VSKVAEKPRELQKPKLIVNLRKPDFLRGVSKKCFIYLFLFFSLKGNAVEKIRETDNERRTSVSYSRAQRETVSRPTTVLRRDKDVRVAQIAKERGRRAAGRGGAERVAGCAGHGKSSLVASLVVCLGRHPLLSPTTLFYTRSHARAHNRAREISLSLSLFLSLSLSPFSASSRSLLCPLTPSPRGKRTTKRIKESIKLKTQL